ncbi:MAG: glycosyltransferase family 39 protein [Planctomycetaceae bacterium]|nr:glycosyltransferase family 39 protein [Planctomycetaceae bacterium]
MKSIRHNFFWGLAVVAIFALSLTLNWTNNNFPLGYHFDEPKKVTFIMTGEQDFHHPILMLELVRWAIHWGTGRTPQEVVELGRTIMAIVGALIPVVMILVAMPYLGRSTAMLVGATLAVTPTMVLHSHYLKEDILLVLLSWAALGAFSQYFRTRNEVWLLVAGLCWGFAMGSHYKGLLVGVVAIPFVLFDGAFTWRMRGVWLLLICGLAVLGFLLPNAVILDKWDVFVSGFNHERNHALTGHFVPIYWSDFYLTYHLRYSLLPGLTYGLGSVAVGSLIWWTYRVNELQRGERLWLAFVWVSYLVPEISPLKPNPDEARYILPMVPGLLYCLVKGGQSLWLVQWQTIASARTASSHSGRHWPQFVWCASLVLISVTVVGLAAYETVQLNHYLNRDTRAELATWAESPGIKLLGEPMTGTDIGGAYAYDVDMDRLRREGYTHYALSSFAYDPYLVTAHLDGQSPAVQARRSAYLALLQQSSKKFEPKHRSFGFSNPTLVVVGLQ